MDVSFCILTIIPTMDELSPDFAPASVADALWLRTERRLARGNTQSGFDSVFADQRLIKKWNDQ